MKKLPIAFILALLWQSLSAIAQPGILRVGFDVDDTVLYSRRLFESLPENKRAPVDYGWINSHDKDYSIPIEPTATLIHFFRAHGHEVYFITSRDDGNGSQLAEYLSDVLGFDVVKDRNLFFSPRERSGENRYTTKHRVMKDLHLDLFYGDSDNDMIAALKAGVHPVRIVRHSSSIEQYGSNYFGNTLDGSSPGAPFSSDDLKIFYRAHVGIFGETIYPIIWDGPPSNR
ncbi:MAG: HAD family acid phosphatase [Fidelibacterota bacterium]